MNWDLCRVVNRQCMVWWQIRGHQVIHTPSNWRKWELRVETLPHPFSGVGNHKHSVLDWSQIEMNVLLISSLQCILIGWFVDVGHNSHTVQIWSLTVLTSAATPNTAQHSTGSSASDALMTISPQHTQTALNGTGEPQILSRNTKSSNFYLKCSSLSSNILQIFV